MGLGKKIGIAAVACTVLFIICCIIVMVQKPEIRPEFYDLIYTDQEQAMQIYKEDFKNNTSTLFKIADTGSSIIAAVGAILAIISIIKMVKGKEKGIIIPILAIIIIAVFYFIVSLSIMDMGALMNSAMNNIQ